MLVSLMNNKYNNDYCKKSLAEIATDWFLYGDKYVESRLIEIDEIDKTKVLGKCQAKWPAFQSYVVSSLPD